MKTMYIKTVLKSQFVIEESLIDSMDEYLWNQVQNFKVGRTEFGKGIYANAEEYRTKSESKFEYHQKMVDIQILVRGHERILFAEAPQNLEELEPYDPQKDIAFCEGLSTGEEELYAGEFCIIRPLKPHMPCMTAGHESEVFKIVFKIPKELLR